MTEWFCTPWYRVEYDLDGRQAFSVVERLTSTHIHLRSTRPLEVGAVLNLKVHAPSRALPVTAEVERIDDRLLVLAVDEPSLEVLHDYLLEDYAPSLESKSHESTSIKSVTEAALVYEELGALDDALRVLRSVVGSAFSSNEYIEWLTELLLHAEEHQSDPYGSIELMHEARVWLRRLPDETPATQAVDARLRQLRSELNKVTGAKDDTSLQDARGELTAALESRDELAKQLAESTKLKNKAEKHRNALLKQHETLRGELAASQKNESELSVQLKGVTAEFNALRESGHSTEEDLRSALEEHESEIARLRVGQETREDEHRAQLEALRHEAEQEQERLRAEIASREASWEASKRDQANSHAEAETRLAEALEELARRDLAFAEERRRLEDELEQASDDASQALRESLEATNELARQLDEQKRESTEGIQRLVTENQELLERLDGQIREKHEALQQQDLEFQRELDARLTADRRASEVESSRRQLEHELETAIRERDEARRRADRAVEAVEASRASAEVEAEEFRRLDQEHQSSLLERERLASTVRGLEAERRRLERVERESSEERARLESDLARLRTSSEQSKAEYAALREDYDSTTTQARRLEVELDAQRAMVHRLGKEARTASEAASQLTGELEELRESAARLEGERDRAVSEAGRLTRELRSVVDDSDVLREELEKSARRHKQLADEVSQSALDSERLERELGAAQSRCRDLTAGLDENQRLRELTNEELRKSQQELRTRQHALVAVSAELADAKSRSEELDQALAHSTDFANRLSEDHSEAKNTIAHLESRAERAEQAGDELRRHVEGVDRQLRETLEERDRLEAALGLARTDAERLSAELLCFQSEADDRQAEVERLGAERAALAEQLSRTSQRLASLEATSLTLIRSERDAKEALVQELDAVGFKWRQLHALEEEISAERQCLAEYRTAVEQWRAAVDS
ncbi:MAG: hypothetical protein AAF654_10795 [Myxococcota bacterium]